ncbi:MAG TPA: hypothetical protein VF144_07190 [Chitinophagaceae bacterium]
MRKYFFLLAIAFYATATNSQNVGVGVANPQNKLHVGGGFRLDTLNGVGGAGLVRHDANGVVYGIKFSGNTSDVLRGDGTFGAFNINGTVGWLLNGNSGTNPATNFLGTTDDQPLLLRVNNIRHGYLSKSIFLGSNAGAANTANGNIGIGSGALNVNTIGSDLVAIGDSAMNKNDEGSSNTAVGHRTLFSNSTGSQNTAIGHRALHANINGAGNSATGYKALELNVNGDGNSAYGHSSLQNNRGSSNNAFGSNALFQNTTGTFNSAFGTLALALNTTGYENTGVGSYSLYFNNGYHNSGVGIYSLYENTSGHDNTSIGYSALLRNTTASFNTSVGARSLYQNTSGETNTATGYNALFANTRGSGNCAYGYQALLNNTGGLGNGNSAFGSLALSSNISGAVNTGVGFLSGSGLPNNVSNVTVIGYNTGWNTTLSNQVNIGNFSVSWIGGQVGWFHYSDKRIKSDIRDDVPGLAFITRLKPITYHVDIRKQDEIANNGKQINQELIRPSQSRNGDSEQQSIMPPQKDWEGKYDVEKIKMTGFFAQDVEEAAKSINYSFSGVHNPKNGGLYSLDYSAFVVPLVKAVQEQQKIIEDQNKKIDKQQQQIDLLIKEMQSLKKDTITQKN